jgi:mannose-6-phosphate isomerase-like protein (cupin superfamily)
MKGYIHDIASQTTHNSDFRRVLYTAKQSQLVLMSLLAKEEIGEEIHPNDQFFRIEAGAGEAILDGVKTPLKAGSCVLVPGGAKHNIVNTGVGPLKLYTLYSPPNHRDGVVHATKQAAVGDNEHFDGKTSE